VAYSHDSPIGFELCGDAPGSCRFAEARIEGSKVALESSGGSRESSAPAPESAAGVPAGAGGAPVTRVRYCWADSPVCTLFDAGGLPAGPFELRVSGEAVR
jgi:sialate O-acetylesterase